MKRLEQNAEAAGAELLRQIPAVDELMGRRALRDLEARLGRAPLAPVAARHAAEIAMCYSNLEYDLEEGERGKRDTHTDRLFAQLLGAEMTLVVNNNAAAVFLALNTLAEGGEVIVSCGEL